MKLAKPRRQSPKHDKPHGSWCDGCVLQSSGAGFVPGTPAGRPVTLVGEAPGYDEAVYGDPFVGAAGSMLTRVLKRVGTLRETYSIDNCVRCVPPDLDIAAFPGAVAQCQYLDEETLSQAGPVVVPMGATALKRLLRLQDAKDVRVQDFHGTITRDPDDRFWVIPTYHPSYLQRGATNLMGVSVFDITRAHEVVKYGRPEEHGELHLNPPIEWFRQWAANYIAAVTQDPYGFPLAVDIETPEKGPDEGELVATADDATYQILQVNFSAHPDEGITVPYEEPYIPLIRDVLQAGGLKYFWFKGYDEPRLTAAGIDMDPLRSYDLMWAWKALQSDLPMGLGFAAPFYSTWGAWKHLAKVAPIRYAAIDGLQTRRVGDGIITDLVAQGRWDVFARHQHRYHAMVLQPATDVGVPIDRPRLMEFKAKLDAAASRLLTEIADQVPMELCPTTPKPGLTRPPVPGAVYTKARDTKADGTPKKHAPDPLKMALYSRATVIEKLVIREITRCATCGAKQVSKTHRCKDDAGKMQKDARPILMKEHASVTRWFWQEPFNPDSPAQLLAYALAKNHSPGRQKKSGDPSMDREALLRLIKDTKDPVYRATLDYRAVAKVRGTYVLGTERRLDAENRLHSTFGFKPSTMRLSSVNPNWQNVIADKGGRESLAAGFRHCVVARGRMVDEESEYAD